jgi:hypothetical protein
MSLLLTLCARLHLLRSPFTSDSVRFRLSLPCSLVKPTYSNSRQPPSEVLRHEAQRALLARRLELKRKRRAERSARAQLQEQLAAARASGGGGAGASSAGAAADEEQKVLPLDAGEEDGEGDGFEDDDSGSDEELLQRLSEPQAEDEDMKAFAHLYAPPLPLPTVRLSCDRLLASSVPCLVLVVRALVVPFERCCVSVPGLRCASVVR